MRVDESVQLNELLVAAARGDQAAFGELYRLTAPRLFALARRLLRRQELAEEILQECYVSIWTHAHDFRPELSAPLTWMFNIVRHRCLDVLRRPDIETPIEDQPHLDEAGDESAGSFEQLALARESRALRECLAALAPRERQMLALAYYRGLSHAEIAAHVGEPLGTVKTLVRRGLMRLRAAIEPSDPVRSAPKKRTAAVGSLRLALPELRVAA